MGNYLPDVASNGFNDALQQVSNDQMLIVYLSSMVKSVIALHNLIDNKLDMNEKEREEEKKEEEARKKKQEDKEAAVKKKAEENEKSYESNEKTEKSEENLGKNPKGEPDR